MIAFRFKASIKTKNIRRYFIPALTVKIIGSIAFGLIFQFYYGGGDTSEYFYHAKVVMSAFENSFSDGIRLFFGDGNRILDLLPYIKKMNWYRSSTEYFVVRAATVFGFLCFGNYTVISLLFAVSSFTGIWAMYKTFIKIHPSLYKEFAIAIFFIPSVFFWGSGLMKDTLTIGALGWLFYGFYGALVEKRNILRNIIISFFAAYVIYSVKVYILLSFLPPAALWVFIENNNRIKNKSLRLILKPIFIVFGFGIALIGATTLTEGNANYDLDNIGERTRINSLYLSEQQASGSAYHIGTFDGSIGSMIAVAPQAIIVSLYRPFIWEVRSPIMALSALEAMMFIYLTFVIIRKIGLFKMIKIISTKPILTFCMVFSLVFAFGVGTNSGNFGTLVRYKIPLMPFYLSALYIMQAYLKRPKKLRRFAVTA
ncbi:hypothetical protein [Rufibacter ruber]|uniref:hypothetical protein n=1 Tax=Rufibacter ruber TaxID=1783499 RepID=UPI00137AE391|nr:hypothetical protein [Rufibacter ruber]